MSDIFSKDYTNSSLGEDFLLSTGPNGGELAVTASGDLDALAGEDNLRQSLIRRLTTPKGYLARFVQDYTGLISVNEDYGNGAYRYLSEPIGSGLIADIRSELKACLSQEPRIELEDILPQIVANGGFVQVIYNINYRVVGSDEMESLALVQSGGNLEIV